MECVRGLATGGGTVETIGAVEMMVMLQKQMLEMMEMMEMQMVKAGKR